MDYKQHKKAILLLEDGTVFEGKSVGMDGTAFGEICYNTGMNYVSCSPYRIPIARIAAAQAAIKKSLI